MAKLHEKMGDYILKLAYIAAKTGEPIVKPMAMVYPDKDYELVKDQFMLGNNIIVAPVLQRNVRSRTIVLPSGIWESDEGEIITGGKTIETDVPLARLPFFTKLK